MNVQSKTMIIENPDGSIQVATQPHFFKKIMIECLYCKSKIIGNHNEKIIDCFKCKKPNKVEKPSDTALMKCFGCSNILIINKSDKFLECSYCDTINEINEKKFIK